MKYGELIRFLQQNGWFALRQRGSYIIMKHPDKAKQIVVPTHASKEVKKGLLVSILKEADIKTKKR